MEIFESHKRDWKIFESHKRDWNLDVTTIKRAVQLVTEDGLVIDDGFEEDVLRQFLYAKGIFSTESFPGKRKQEYNAILHPQTKELKSAFERLDRIVNKGETTPPTTPQHTPLHSPLSQKSKKVKTANGSSFFSKFVKGHPEWGKINSFYHLL